MSSNPSATLPSLSGIAEQQQPPKVPLASPSWSKTPETFESVCRTYYINDVNDARTLSTWQPSAELWQATPSQFTYVIDGPRQFFICYKAFRVDVDSEHDLTKQFHKAVPAGTACNVFFFGASIFERSLGEDFNLLASTWRRDWTAEERAQIRVTREQKKASNKSNVGTSNVKWQHRPRTTVVRPVVLEAPSPWIVPDTVAGYADLVRTMTSDPEKMRKYSAALTLWETKKTRLQNMHHIAEQRLERRPHIVHLVKLAASPKGNPDFAPVFVSEENEIASILRDVISRHGCSAPVNTKVKEGWHVHKARSIVWVHRSKCFWKVARNLHQQQYPIWTWPTWSTHADGKTNYYAPELLCALDDKDVPQLVSPLNGDATSAK